MNRRGFFKFLGLGTVSAAVAPVALAPWAPPLVPLKAAASVAPVATDISIPELWCRESVRILQENMVIGNLVHRDNDSQVSRCQDRVNIAGRCGTGS